MIERLRAFFCEVARANPEAFARQLFRLPQFEREGILFDLAQLTNLTRTFWEKEMAKIGEKETGKK